MRTPDDRRRALAEGATAEDRVADALSADGWTILERNWRTKMGEIDIIVVRAGVLRFVEVKARAPGALVDLESVTPSKQRKLVATAEAWLLNHGDDWTEMAFVVALVDLDTWDIEWVDDAFDG